jgi:hypothetical protein
MRFSGVLAGKYCKNILLLLHALITIIIVHFSLAPYMTSPSRRKKATFALDEAILEDAKKILLNTDYRSLNAFVETAIIEKIKRHHKEEIKRQLLAASQDPLFLEDIAEVQRDFQNADWESLEKDS